MARIRNKPWYLFRNIVIALGYMGVSSSTAFIEGEAIKIVLYLVGGLLILSALLAFRDSGFTVWPVALIGIGLIALADYLISNYEVMTTVAHYLSCGLLIIFAFFQYRKRSDHFGSGTKLAFIMRLLPYLYPTLLIAGIVCIMIPSLLQKESVEMLLGAGAVGWIVYTVLAVKTYNSSSSGSSNNTSSSGSKSASSGGGGKTVADVATVRKAMESVASFSTGGVENLVNSANIYFSVDVTVYEGEINFTVNGKVRGSSSITTQSALDNATRRIESVMRAKQKRVMELANKKMNGLLTDVDYDINVVAGNITQDK